ncbi:MAG: biopolymer transporter ExbD [Alistipes sp.]
MATDKRKIQEINAGSMADIAFLLLIFFLVATTMNVDTGLVRVLPPMPPENVQQKANDVKERNVYLVLVNGAGQIMAGAQNHQTAIDFRQLKDLAKEFILNPMDDPNLPEKENTEIALPDGGKWTYPVSAGVVSLQTTRDTGYQIYILVQNELTRAFNEVRDEASMKKFNKKFADLSEGERKVMTTAVPLKISEAEPRNMGGKK